MVLSVLGQALAWVLLGKGLLICNLKTNKQTNPKTNQKNPQTNSGFLIAGGDASWSWSNRKPSKLSLSPSVAGGVTPSPSLPSMSVAAQGATMVLRAAVTAKECGQ